MKQLRTTNEQRKLPIPGFRLRVGDRPECRIGRRLIWRIETGLIERIVDLGPELNLDAFRHREGLEQRPVPRPLSVAANSAEAQRKLPVVQLQLLRHFDRLGSPLPTRQCPSTRKLAKVTTSISD
jgi:hypothetical protein